MILMQGVDEPATADVIRWAAEQAVRMHDRGRHCQMCPLVFGDCRHLKWARDELANDAELRRGAP